jgi:hypothetical protein
VEDLWRDLERGHAVGFEPECELGVVVGDVVVVDGFIKAGVGVGKAADEADELHVLLRRHVF